MKKKVLIVLTVITIIIIEIYAKCIKLNVTLKTNRVVEINRKFYNTKFIKKINNGKVVDKKIISFKSLGKKTITIKVKNKIGNIVKYKYDIKVKDSQKPQITYNDNITYEEGSEIDLLKDLNVQDNSKEKIDVKIEGKYDINTPGIYKLYYVAQDSSSNKEKKEFTLTITKKENLKRLNNNSFTTSKGFKGIIKDGITYIDGILIANKTYSLPSDYNPGLDPNVLEKANQMFETAKNQGLNISITSGFRSYNTQETLYNNYVSRDGKQAADTYSARPGHSEHQTGLAFDVNQINSSFDNTNEAIWLKNNCYKFGFILRYPQDKSNETGYNYESWHYRYVGENLASKLYNNGDWITLESYFGITSAY